MQLEGQIQVLNEGLDFFALGADGIRFFSRLGTLRKLLGKLLCVAHNQRQWGADVVGNPGNPVGPGHVPAGNQVVLLLEVAAGLVQLFRQLCRGPGFLQIDFFSFGKAPDTLCQCPQRSGTSPAQKQANCQNQPQIQQEQRPKGGQQGVQNIIVHVKIEPGHAAFGLAYHQQPIVVTVDHHRVIFQIPPGKGGDLGNGIGVIQLLRQMLRPENFSSIT